MIILYFHLQLQFKYELFHILHIIIIIIIIIITIIIIIISNGISYKNTAC